MSKMMMFTFRTYNVESEDNESIDEFTEHSVPGKFEICSRCGGHGSHTNPAIDGHGIGADEWNNEWDEDDRENYMSGAYDIGCEARCTEGKIVIPDTEFLTPEQKLLLAKWDEQQEEKYKNDMEDAALYRAESGYY